MFCLTLIIPCRFFGMVGLLGSKRQALQRKGDLAKANSRRNKPGGSSGRLGTSAMTGTLRVLGEQLLSVST